MNKKNLSDRSNKKNVSVSLDLELLQFIDDYATTVGISRAAAISVLINQNKQAQNNASALNKLMEVYTKQKIVEDVNSPTLEELVNEAIQKKKDLL